MNELTRTAPDPLALTNLDDMFRLADALAKSAMFVSSGVTTAAQAVVKILAGRELGFPPLASLVGIHLIEGKPSVGSHLLAAAIRSSGRYDYVILEHSDEVCAIQFMRKAEGHWEALKPIEKLTLREAVGKGWTTSNAGKAKANWAKTPKNMLFARCLTNGHKFHCPDLFHGLLFYDQDELEPAGEAPVTISAPRPAVDAEFTPTNGTAAPQTPAAGAAADPTPPAPSATDQPDHLTDQEYETLVSLARANNRTQADVTAICAALSVPVLRKAPRSKLTWLTLAMASGLASPLQRDKITDELRRLNTDFAKVPARLQTLYSVSSIAHLLPSQAMELEAKLRTQPTPQLQSA